MRLIDTRTGLFHWVDRPTEVPYAILSHVWDGDRELSFHALSRAHAEAFRSPDTLESNPNMIFDRIPGKVRDFCVFAREQGYAFVWVDTCCIDKSSSAELSEAINSMYAWYQQASVCYAYLYDVTARGAPHSSFQAHQQLSDSQWHKRGWTLQELIAPRTVVFLSRDWRVVGTKDSLAHIIKTITGIDTEILSHQTPLSSVSVARRMSWASRRVTRRIEDRAYSLMGIFGIHMPTIYGEGRYAFVRLQEEILKQLPDQTLFVWGPRVFFPDWSKASLSTAPALPQPDAPLLASEPDAFKPEGKNMELVAVSHSKLAELVGIGNLPLPRYAITGYGTRARLPTLPVGGLPHREDRLLLALLGCLDGDNRVLALVLRREHRGSQQFGVGARVESSTTPYAGSSYARLAVLTLQQLEAVRDDVCVQDVYISHRLTQAPSASPGNLSEVATVVCKWPYETSNTLATIQVAPWSLEMLTELGYKVDGAMPRTSTAPADSDGLLEVSLISENIQLRISIVPCCFQPVPHPRVYSVRHKRLRAEVSYVWHDFSPPSGHLVAIDASDGELSHSPDEPPCQHSRSHHATHWTRVATTDAVQATFSFLKSQDEPPTGPGRTPPLWGRLRLTLRSMPDQRRVTGWEMEEDAPVFRMMLDVELMEERPQWTWGRDVPGVGRVRLGEDWTACDSESDPGSESEPENEVGRQPSRAAGGDSFEITRLMQSTSQMGFGRAGC